MRIPTRQEVDQEIIDFSFYLIQRGESGHRSGCKTEQYRCSSGVLTIGYGTALERPHSHINYPNEKIDEATAVYLARAEMRNKLYQKCRNFFPTRPGMMRHACFDTMLPCHQALVLDLAYQGLLTSEFADALKNNDIVTALSIVSNNDNVERSAVRARALSMGEKVRMYKDLYPNKNPEVAAREITQEFISQNIGKVGDQEVTRDEIALLYRSCMAVYNVPVTRQQVENFANSFRTVAVGRQGIGDPNRLPTTNLVSDEQAIEYTTPANNRNNPRDGFNKDGTKTVGFETLQEGYNALVGRLKNLASKGEYTPLELWIAFTGVSKNMSGIPLMERMREKGVWVDENTKINLNDPQVLEAVALSISEMNNGGYPLGGKQKAIEYIAAAAGYDPTKIRRLRYRPSSPRTLSRASSGIPPYIDLETLSAKKTTEQKWRYVEQRIKEEKKAEEARKRREKETAKNQRRSSQQGAKKNGSSKSSDPTYVDPKPENNNPGRIWSKGKHVRYASVSEGYGALTSILYKNHDGRTALELVQKLMGGKTSHAKELLKYLRENGVDIKDINTKLDLKDPKILKAVVLSYTQLRHKGKFLGGRACAEEAVSKKIQELLPQNDGVTVVVEQSTSDATRSLAFAGHGVSSSVSVEKDPFTR